MTDAETLEFVHYMSDLLCRYVTRDIREDELIILYNWAYSDPSNKDLFEEMSDLTLLYDSLSHFLGVDHEGMLRKVWDRLSHT